MLTVFGDALHIATRQKTSHYGENLWADRYKPQTHKEERHRINTKKDLNW